MRDFSCLSKVYIDGNGKIQAKAFKHHDIVDDFENGIFDIKISGYVEDEMERKLFDEELEHLISSRKPQDLGFEVLHTA